MPRIRYLKPEFFFDEDLADLSFAERLGYQGLWCNADKAGRLEDCPKKLKAMIFPYDAIDMSTCLQALTAKPFIQRYEADGKRYIQIIHWHKHQKPHHTEKESTIPPPPTAPAPPPITPLKIKGMGKGMEKQLAASTELNNGCLTVKDANALFEKLWAKYPRRERRKDAYRHFVASVVDNATASAIWRAMDNYLAKLAAEKTDPRYIQQGGTWFNNWQDWVDYQGPAAAQNEHAEIVRKAGLA